MNYLRGGLGMSRKTDEVETIAKPLTPRSEMADIARGMLRMSMQNLQGLCAERKCVRKADHEGECWPK